MEQLVPRRKVGQAPAQRARIVLAYAEPDATNLGVGKPTVASWRRRFAADGLEGLVDAPPPGKPRIIDGWQSSA